MLANTLNTNEIKNAAGVECEFQRLGPGTGAREAVFASITEQPCAPYRLTIKHSESGKGVNLRRRSLIRFDKTVNGAVDTTKVEVVSAYCVLDVPIGNQATYDEAKNVLANLMSFMASTGATTTILFDCTGNGAVTAITGGL